LLKVLEECGIHGILKECVQLIENLKYYVDVIILLTGIGGID